MGFAPPSLTGASQTSANAIDEPRIPGIDGTAIADAAQTFKRHFENIITYLSLRITNASAESLNAKIQWIKYQARGFRNEGRFKRAILFHCAGLDLYPAHSNS